MESALLSDHIKSGTVVTNALGVANIVFRTQIPYGMTYMVQLTCADPGSNVVAYPSNQTQTGFTITTKESSRAPNYVVVASVTVYWLVTLEFNS